MKADDPKFTTYALGELDQLSESEIAEIKEAINEGEELRRELEEIKTVSGLVSTAYGEEAKADLTEEQKSGLGARIESGLPNPDEDGKVVRFPWIPVLSAAAAILLVAQIGILSFDRKSEKGPVEVAQAHLEPEDEEVHDGSLIESPPSLADEKSVSEVSEFRSTDRPDPIAPAAVVLPDLQLEGRKAKEAEEGLSFLEPLPPMEVMMEQADESYTATQTLAGTRVASISKTRTFWRRGRNKRESQMLSHPHPWPEPPIPPMPRPIPVPLVWNEDFNTETYDSIVDNPFIRTEGQNALSTFSIDVDTASYANVRRFLNDDELPPKDSVRIEEMINYFPYDYAPPVESSHPFSVHLEVANAPWKTDHRLVRVGLKGKEIAWEERPPSNVVFLVDVSGSMRPPNKLPLVKKSLEMLVRRFGERDRVAIVTYAGSSSIALPSTTANNTETILHSIRGLGAGGSTHASAGIEEAYEIAEKHFLKEGNNRVVLCTDGDFNVGVTNRGELVRIVEKHAKKGIFLSILGFGMGNLKDATLEELSNKGNGKYGYIDSQREARKVFVEQASGTLVTIAKDVKIQVEFNPAHVSAYRLIGYENRKLAARDFNDDTTDAGEIGAGHTVTALYEVVPEGVEFDIPPIDSLKYQKPVENVKRSRSDDLLTVKLRYKEPDATKSQLLEYPLIDKGGEFENPSEDYRFASAVAAFGMILRESPHKGESSIDMVRAIAEGAQGNNRGGYRSEFLLLVDQVEMLLERKGVHNPPPPQPVPEPKDGVGPSLR